jgi:hypothetical protein
VNVTAPTVELADTHPQFIFIPLVKNVNPFAAAVKVPTLMLFELTFTLNVLTIPTVLLPTVNIVGVLVTFAVLLPNPNDVAFSNAPLAAAIAPTV